MPPRPDPSPKLYSSRDKVDGTPYYKKRQVQPGFPGATVPDTKRKALGQALQNVSRKYGTMGRTE